jgi:hypothetical protein
VRLWAVLSEDSKSLILPLYTDLTEDRYPSLTPRCPQAHWFEREIFEQWAIEPEGHPWLKPIRFHSPYRQSAAGTGASREIGVTDFFRVVPRNHHVEEVIQECEETGRVTLADIFLQVLRSPYEELAQTSEYQDLPSDGDKNYQTFCGT